VQETPASSRIRILDKEHYSVDLEYTKDFAILHLPRVDRFNKSVYLDMKSTIKSIWERVLFHGWTNLWVAVPETDEALGKLVSRLGFVHSGTADNMNVFEYGEV